MHHSAQSALQYWQSREGALDGMKCEFLGMTFDFTEKGKVMILMLDHVGKMIEQSPFKLGKLDTSPTPAAPNLFEKGSGKLLNAKRREAFHTIVAQGLVKQPTMQ